MSSARRWTLAMVATMIEGIGALRTHAGATRIARLAIHSASTASIASTDVKPLGMIAAQGSTTGAGRDHLPFVQNHPLTF